MSELAFLLTILLAFAGMLGLIAGYGVAAYFKRRNPALFRRELPAVSAATVRMLRSRDGEMPTCAIDLKLTSPHQPIHSIPSPRLAVEAAPAHSRSRS